MPLLDDLPASDVEKIKEIPAEDSKDSSTPDVDKSKDISVVKAKDLSPPLLKDLLTTVLEEIKRIPAGDSSDLHLAVRIESRLAYEALYKIIEQEIDELKNNKTEVKASPENVKKLLIVLAERWNAIFMRVEHVSDAIYCHSVHSRANRAYWILAEAIAPIVKKHPLDLVMTNIDAANKKTHKGTLCDLKLHEFILGDKNSENDTISIIDVFDCFDKATSAHHHTMYNTTTGDMLTKFEKERVRNHSEAARNYFIALFTDASVEIPKKNFIAALEDVDNYNVKSSYGDKGNNQLLYFLMDETGTTTLEKLSEFLWNYVPQNEWVKFLDLFNKEYLDKLILDNKPLDEAVAVKEHYTGDEKKDKTKLFCFLYYYWFRDRSEKPDQYTTPYGGLFAKCTFNLAGGYKIEDKKKAALTILDFLQSDVPFSGFKEYMRTQIPDKTLRKAAYTGNLGCIGYQIKAIADPAFFAGNVCRAKC